MSSGSHPTANDVRMDRRDPRHERRPAHPTTAPSITIRATAGPRRASSSRGASGERHAQRQARSPPSPAPPPAPPSRTAARSARAFTFGHGGRQVRIGPVAFWTVVGTLVIMAGWSVVTATYFAFQDDVLARMIAHEAEMQFAYEDRIAEMRAQVDRVTSRQLLDQEQTRAEARPDRAPAVAARAARNDARHGRRPRGHRLGPRRRRPAGRQHAEAVADLGARARPARPPRATPARRARRPSCRRA